MRTVSRAWEQEVLRIPCPACHQREDSRCRDYSGREMPNAHRDRWAAERDDWLENHGYYPLGGGIYD